MGKREFSEQELIERSLLTTYRGKIWGSFIKAIKEYELLKPGYSVCVCISGGKDSTLLDKIIGYKKNGIMNSFLDDYDDIKE